MLPEEELFFYKRSVELYLTSNDKSFKKIKKEKEIIIDLNDILLKITILENKLLLTKKIQGASVYDIIEKIFGITRENAGCFKIVRKNILSTPS